MTLPSFDMKPEKVRNATSAYDIMGMTGNIVDPSVIASIDMDETDLFIAVTTNDEVNLLSCMLALLPNTSASFMNLMVAESPGPDVSKLVPKVRDTAKYLYSMYIGLSLIQVVLLLAEGMPLFDTLTLTMGTAGTVGFAVRSSGFADYTLLQQARSVFSWSPSV